MSLLFHVVYALRKRLILDNLLDPRRIIVRTEVMYPCRLVDALLLKRLRLPRPEAETADDNDPARTFIEPS